MFVFVDRHGADHFHKAERNVTMSTTISDLFTA